LDDAKMIQLKNKFKELDHNNHGVISVNQLKQLMNQMGLVDTEQEIQKMMEKMTMNCNLMRFVSF
jgi:Ca2+-binding EF-hand superfamily protein